MSFLSENPRVKKIWKWITTKDPFKIGIMIVVLVLSFLSWYFSFTYPAVHSHYFYLILCTYATKSITNLSNEITLETVDKVGEYITNFMTAPMTSIDMSGMRLPDHFIHLL